MLDAGHLVHRLQQKRRELMSRFDPLRVIAASATIHNPALHLETLTGLSFQVVDDQYNGSPKAELTVQHAVGRAPHDEGRHSLLSLIPNPPKRLASRRGEGVRKCSFASGIMVFETGNLPETRSTQQMLPLEHPDRIQIAFDDHRLVNNAGLLLPATLAQHVGLRELVDRHLDLGSAPGRANTGDKMMTLVASALAGGDCIDAADALRTGGTACTLGCTVKAPSTLGTFLRSFRWGQVRQLDRVSRELLTGLPRGLQGDRVCRLSAT